MYVVCGPLCFKSEKTGLPNLIRSLVRKKMFQPEKDLGKEVFVQEWNWFFSTILPGLDCTGTQRKS